MQAVIEKLDNDIAILAVKDDPHQSYIPVPISWLPDEAREGDCIEIALLPDYKRLEELQKEVRQMFGQLSAGFNVREKAQSQLKQAVLSTLKRLVRNRGGHYYLVNLDNAAEEIASAVAEVQ